MSLITETNQQYYQGAQGFRGDNATVDFKTTFDTSLILGSFDPNNINYALNNFKLYTSSTGLPGDYYEYTDEFTVVNNAITFEAGSEPEDGLYIVVQLKKLCTYSTLKNNGNYSLHIRTDTVVVSAIRYNIAITMKKSAERYHNFGGKCTTLYLTNYSLGKEKLLKSTLNFLN